LVASDKSVESSANSEQLSKLQNSKADIVDNIMCNREVLRNMDRALKLDAKLPESARIHNSHLNEIKEDFSSFFDEDSGNNTMQESFDEIREYLKDEQECLKSELDTVNSDIKRLISDGEKSSSTGEHSVSEFSTDTEQPFKKPKRSGRDDDDNNKGPGGASGSSAPSAPSSPSSSSSPLSSSYQGLPENSPRNLGEGNCSDSNLIFWLDILLKILKALSQDDDYMD